MPGPRRPIGSTWCSRTRTPARRSTRRPRAAPRRSRPHSPPLSGARHRGLDLDPRRHTCRDPRRDRRPRWRRRGHGSPRSRRSPRESPVTQTSIVGVIVPGAFHLAAEMLRSGVLSQTQDGPTGNPVEVHRLPLGPGGLPGALERPGADGGAQDRLVAGRGRARRSSSPVSSLPTAPPSWPGSSTGSSPPTALRSAPSSCFRAGPRSAAVSSPTRGPARSPSPVDSSPVDRSPRPAPRASPRCSSSSAATTRWSCCPTPTPTSRPERPRTC